MERVRIAMIGCGRWARRLALEAALTPLAELASCFDRDHEAARRFAAEFGVRAVSSLDELLGDPSIEAGVACVPNSAHREVAEALAGVGKHVFVPRPMAARLDAAKAMAAACASRGVVLFVDHSGSFSPEVEAMHEAASSGRVGRILSAHLFRSADWGRSREAGGGESWHLSPKECPGGPATLLGVPAAATLARLLGRPRAVRGSMESGITESRVPDIATFLIEHESGAHSTLVTSGVSAVAGTHMYVYGTEGDILYGPTAAQAGPRVLLAESRSRVVSELALPERKTGGLGMFVDQVRKGVEPPATLEMALVAMATIEAGLRSVSDERRVTVAELLR